MIQIVGLSHIEYSPLLHVFTREYPLFLEFLSISCVNSHLRHPELIRLYIKFDFLQPLKVILSKN